MGIGQRQIPGSNQSTRDLTLIKPAALYMGPGIRTLSPVIFGRDPVRSAVQLAPITSSRPIGVGQSARDFGCGTPYSKQHWSRLSTDTFWHRGRDLGIPSIHPSLGMRLPSVCTYGSEVALRDMVAKHQAL